MKHIFTLVLLLAGLTAGAQPNNGTEYHFGFCLMPNTYGGLITYGIVHVRNGNVIGTTPLTRENWVKQVAGEAASPANKKLENLFIKNEVERCWVLYDEWYYKYGEKKYVGYDCSILDTLWMMRYANHPYQYGVEGWGGDYAPTGDQRAFLKKYYGVFNNIDYFWGDNMFQLLKDIRDPDWIDFYMDGDLTWSREPEGGEEEDEGGSDPPDDEGEEEEDENPDN